MRKIKVGFIGMGNMASALSKGFLAAGKLTKETTFAFAPNQEKLRKNGETVGFTPCHSLQDLLLKSEVCKGNALNHCSILTLNASFINYINVLIFFFIFLKIFSDSLRLL